MAEKKVEKAVSPTKKEKSYFPKLTFLFGLILIVIAVVRFFNWYSINNLTVNILLVLAGLWIFFLGLSHGFEKQRKDLFKKYI